MLASLLAGFMFFATKIAPVMASILITIAYIPQIWKSHRTKNVEGIALWFWILINLFLVAMVSNALGLFIINGASAIGYLITELINFLFALWQLILVIVYGKEIRKKQKEKRKAEGKKWWHVSL